MTSRPFVVGIIGGGQLARMMYAASVGLGVRVRLLAEGPDVSAATVVHDVTVGDYTDPETVRAFADGCDVITFDHEHVPTGLLRDLEAAGIAVRPGPAALVHAQDKAVMRDRLTALGAPCPTYRVVPDADALAAFGAEHGWPVIAKVARGGYDGRGVWKIDGPDDAALPFAGRADGVPVIAEEFVPFARELSALVVRSPSGQAAAYPVTQSIQRNGICVETITPAPDLTEAQAVEIERLALTIAAELGVVGVLAVELMQRTDGSVVVNELAMRPHNTGHWSIDGAHTSQFENHLRAVLDLPLGRPGPAGRLDGDEQRAGRVGRGPAVGAAALLRPGPPAARAALRQAGPARPQGRPRHRGRRRPRPGPPPRPARRGVPDGRSRCLSRPPPGWAS